MPLCIKVCDIDQTDSEMELGFFSSPTYILPTSISLNTRFPVTETFFSCFFLGVRHSFPQNPLLLSCCRCCQAKATETQTGPSHIASLPSPLQSPPGLHQASEPRWVCHPLQVVLRVRWCLDTLFSICTYSIAEEEELASLLRGSETTQRLLRLSKLLLSEWPGWRKGDSNKHAATFVPGCPQWVRLCEEG